LNDNHFISAAIARRPGMNKLGLNDRRPACGSLGVFSDMHSGQYYRDRLGIDP
jgi:hypothetical protein